MFIYTDGYYDRLAEAYYKSLDHKEEDLEEELEEDQEEEETPQPKK